MREETSSAAQRKSADVVVKPIVVNRASGKTPLGAKIYPRSVTGWFANCRWILVWLTQILFYGLCWVSWNGRQAVLFDLVERKFYLFDLTFWPQDVIYLTLLLIISAYGLFWFTAIGGRLFCGYACPQTVYTEIFLWIEEKFEGGRVARMRLDQQPLNGERFLRKGGKHAVWLLFSAWTGFTFVAYFTPAATLAQAVLHAALSGWETFWIGLYGLMTYGNAGFMRHLVCLHMCPYARFQSVMFDPDTLVVTYDTERGEPRGSRSKKAEAQAAKQGDCVDCGICVQVCPTGIDIRDGLQYECIGCSACIDACDQVMDKVGSPRGLIRYSTEHALEQHWGKKEILAHVIRPRVVIYGLILAILVAGLVYGIATRLPLKVDVLRDRSSLSREVEEGLIENLYRLQIMNVSDSAHRYSIGVSGLEGADIAAERIAEVPAGSTRTVLVPVRVPQPSGKRGANVIYFEVKALSNEKVAVREKASFIMP